METFNNLHISQHDRPHGNGTRTRHIQCIETAQQWNINYLLFFSLSGNHIFQGQAAGIAVNENGRGMIVGMHCKWLHSGP